MYFSKYNILSKIKDSPNSFIVNPLTKNVDLLTPEKANEIRTGQYTDLQEYLERGYLIDKEEEERLYRNAYLEFLDSRDESETQIFFVPWYACNFNCSYCYQEGYTPQAMPLKKEVMDAFFNYVDKTFAGKKKYITLFGGEPLLAGNAAKESIRYFLQQAGERNLAVAIVTNGYELSDYLDILRLAPIREIQVTLDGTQSVHDQRRPLKNGQPTFSKIVEGIDRALERRHPINLRIVLDKGNLAELPELARFAIQKGWTKNLLFKTQIGRNYELHFCQKDNQKLYDRVSIYQDIYQLIQEHPHILEFHKPAFSISRFLFENGELPDPLFDSCPGCKTEWAFDYTGGIYACTATVGKSGESLGTFYPEVKRDEDTINQWEERDVTSITQCRDCSLQLACGGGCASMAKNSSGKLLAPDCRPVKELMEMGISLYFEKELL